MPYDFVLCDVFAEGPFGGNQLAVFPRADGLSEELMASLAVEFGWSEITFVTGERNGVPRVRIWTPFGELPFAGHPTIGTAVVLAALGVIETGWAALDLGVGRIPIQVRVSDGGGTATMIQREPEFGEVYSDRSRIAAALGLSEDDLASELPIQAVSTGLQHFLVPLRSLQALERAAPPRDLPEMPAAAGAQWAYAFTTETPHDTAAARARLLSADFEDAATGSAAGPLGAYLVRYGLHRAGEMEIEQGVEMGRPSRIRVDVPVEAGKIGRVRVTGAVWIWGQGALQPSALSSSIL
jgi:trans-2,3-dihydro-3-hydroxyanthranilate isomerase